MVIEIDVAPHADNRLLRVKAVSEDFSWQGEQVLYGEDSPREFVFDVRHLPAGDYRVLAELLGASGHVRGTIQRYINVMPTGLSFPLGSAQIN